MTNRLLLLTALFCSYFLCAQEITITGNIYDEYLEPFKGAKIKTKTGKTTLSDEEGLFKIKIALPGKLTISADGFEDEKINVTNSSQEINLVLKESSALDVQVVSATRSSVRMFESPVTIERISGSAIKNTTAINYFEELGNKSSVDVRSNSFNIKTINSRGFSTLRNTRFVTLIDGADNQYLGSSISFGNSSAIADIDVATAELLPGAASALYGSSAFNGILLVNSKNPFDYSGISVDLRSGITQQKEYSGNTKIGRFYNPSIRLAYNFNDNFAAKVVFNHSYGQDWTADDYRNINNLEGDSSSHNVSDYNGVNIYGDEIFKNIKALEFRNFFYNPAKFDHVKYSKLPNKNLTRTGYKENSLRSKDHYKAINTTFAFHYRPTGTEKLELIWTSRFNTTDNVLLLSPSKYEKNDDRFDTHMIDIKGTDFYIKAYANYMNGGDETNLKVLGANIDESYRTYYEWYDRYLSKITEGKSDKIARNYADKGRPVPGSKLFNYHAEKSRNKLISNQGSKLVDATALYNTDWNYNFNRHIKFANIQVGGSFRRILLGTIEEGRGLLFTDYEKTIKFNEWSIYTQIDKKFLDERLKLLSSLRYDKSQNFEGNFSPRLSVMYVAGENRNHNFRIAAQTAFKNPSVLDQYFGLKFSKNGYLVGNISDNKKRFIENTGVNVNKYGFTKESYNNFFEKVFSPKYLKNNANIEDISKRIYKSQGILETDNFEKTKLKCEELKSIEIGYRGLVSMNNRIIEIDFTGYYNNFTDFIVNKSLYIPDLGDVNAPKIKNILSTEEIKNNPFAKALLSLASSTTNKEIIMATNTSAEIHSYGLGSSFSSKVGRNFNLVLSYCFANHTYNKEKYPNIEPSFNMPKHRLKFSIGNPKLTNNLGFKINAKWESSYEWQSQYIDGTVKARTLLDAQVSYSVPALKTTLKLGATNIGGQTYHTAIGTPDVGSVYYLSWMIN